ncbi:TRAP transporter large permease subunit [Salicibibacter halophilus]|uniref:TRAP transporter large permease subunit n=1 Tax=Salicibibacter halophilus TaxID=2502791 RepID=A0A514LF95_9BACI|nr:TRAP transporter large permease subunit [Salicibibacter halophilus]QDI90520.1 TRAP transporter large permease subunit [Salicibibacter halophilus]
MDIGVIAIILFGSLFLFLFLGVQVSFAMGGISIIMGLIFWDGFSSLDGFVLGSYEHATQSILTALPLYIFMAAVLMYSDLAEDMYEVIYRWFGGIRGGLAAGTSVVSAVFASMVGVVSVATAALGMVARPSMLKRGYDDKLTLGVIMAGGVLGVLIPPSIVMIVYASESGESAGALFMAGILPGILAAILFIIYSLVLCFIKPEKGPNIEVGHRFTWAEKFWSLKGIILPAVVIFLVLGSIYLGVATPTEAGAVGAAGALFAAGTRKKLNMENIKSIFLMTARLSGMIFWILIGAVAYARIVAVTGVGDWLAGMITETGFNRWIILILILLFFLILGMFIDTVAVLLITAPLFLPVLTALDFNMIWFGILFCIAVCIGNLTPPFGVSLFIMKGVAGDLNIRSIYAAVWPFIFLLLLLLIIIILIPEIALLLPALMMD